MLLFLCSSLGDEGPAEKASYSMLAVLRENSGGPTGKMAEEEVKGRKKRPLQTVREPHTQLSVSVREGGVPAPRGRNRCLTLNTTRSVWNREAKGLFASQPHTLTLLRSEQ